MNPNSYSGHPDPAGPDTYSASSSAAYVSSYSQQGGPVKKKTGLWTKILIVLVSILIVITSVLTASIFMLKNSIAEIAKPYSELVVKNEDVELSNSRLLAQFYDLLVGEVSKYGSLDDAQEASASLLTQIFVRTMKDCTVETIEFDEDHIVIEVQGMGVPLSALNAGLITSAAGSAAGSYLMQHPLSAISSIFSGAEGIKGMIYGDYIALLIETIKDRIKDMPAKPIHYTLVLRVGQDGKWILEDSQESVGEPDKGKQDENQESFSSSSGQDFSAEKTSPEQPDDIDA